MRFKKTLSAGIFMALIVAALTTIQYREARAQNPTQGSAPVTIVNPLPLPVTDVGAAAREPAQFRTVGTVFTGGLGSVNLVTVPAGKRLVVEHISAIVNDNSGSGLAECVLSTSTSNPIDFLPCESMGSNALNHYYAVNRQTKLYVPAGAVVSFRVSNVSGTGSGSVAAFISGYYEAEP